MDKNGDSLHLDVSSGLLPCFFTGTALKIPEVYFYISIFNGNSTKRVYLALYLKPDDSFLLKRIFAHAKKDFILCTKAVSMAAGQTSTTCSGTPNPTRDYFFIAFPRCAKKLAFAREPEKNTFGGIDGAGSEYLFQQPRKVIPRPLCHPDKNISKQIPKI